MARTPFSNRIRRGAASMALGALLAGCGAALPGSGGSRDLALAAPAQPEADGDEVEDVPTEPPVAIPSEPAQPDMPQPQGIRAFSSTTGSAAGTITGSTTEAYEASFRADSDGEGVMALTARGFGTDWAAAGRESAVVTVYLDGRYNQDIILSRGETPAEYRVLLGPIARGDHRFEIRYRPELSSSGARGAQVVEARPEVRVPGDPDFDAIAGAPILYARPEAHRSDTPLFLTYQRLATGLRYTMYVSNEDGGTPSADLMAVWGRACDIDWIYRQNQIQSGARSGAADTEWATGNKRGQGGFIQGFLHRQLAYRGQFEARHPILRVSTNNNMVSDQGTSRFKLRPFVLPAPPGSRERALDLNPWAYRLTGVELAREGKLRAPGEREALLSNLLGKKIADMRRYVTIEFEHPGGTKLGFRLRLQGESDWHLSTSGRFWRAIKRTGTVRTTIELPAGASVSQIAAVGPITSNGKPYGGRVRVTRAFAFDQDYRQIPLPQKLGFTGP